MHRVEPDGALDALEDEPRVVLLMGPTAAGKTALALELVQRFPLDVVSVDSAQVFRQMNIGTAKPEPEVLRRVPHRLIDIRDPWESYSAAEFLQDAGAAIHEIHAAGRSALLVGGTMLYFRALTRGLSPLPAADPGVRRRLEREAREHGWEALHHRLAELDPKAARRIHPNDPQRIQRALEVQRLTGVPISELQARGGAKFPARYLKLIVSPTDRTVLHRRIEQRFDGMLDLGLVAEVADLKRDQRMSADLPSMRAVGYRQVWRHLEGCSDREQMRAEAIAASRQLAKRQLTWLRRVGAAQRLDPSADGAVAAIARSVERFLR